MPTLMPPPPLPSRRQMLDTEDELREMGSDAAVPSEVRDWLAATFTQQARAKGRRAEEKPKFRSIVHAVQAGIFVERWVLGGTPPRVDGEVEGGHGWDGDGGWECGPQLSHGSQGLCPAPRWVLKHPGGFSEHPGAVLSTQVVLKQLGCPQCPGGSPSTQGLSPTPRWLLEYPSGSPHTRVCPPAPRWVPKHLDCPQQPGLSPEPS